MSARAARPRANGAPTLESVAALAGVSRATAGRVLAGSSTVGEQAREAVLRAAAELSYVTNRAARSLMTRRSDSIAFVVAESDERFFADPYFSQVLRGVHAAVAAHDVQLVFAVLGDQAERERFERFARGGHVDGAVFVSLHGADPLPQRLQDAGVPVVISGRPLGARVGPSPLAYVDADNVEGARSAVRLLAERGRQPAGHHHRAAGHGRRPGPLRRLPRRAGGAGADRDRGGARRLLDHRRPARRCSPCSTARPSWTPCSRPTT